jgi:hypothetical protein
MEIWRSSRYLWILFSSSHASCGNTDLQAENSYSASCFYWKREPYAFIDNFANRAFIFIIESIILS